MEDEVGGMRILGRFSDEEGEVANSFTRFTVGVGEEDGVEVVSVGEELGLRFFMGRLVGDGEEEGEEEEGEEDEDEEEEEEEEEGMRMTSCTASSRDGAEEDGRRPRGIGSCDDNSPPALHVLLG